MSRAERRWWRRTFTTAFFVTIVLPMLAGWAYGVLMHGHP